MPKLFASPKDMQYVQDLHKEYMKDIWGLFVYLYPISTMKTQVHPVYDEAIEKIFENPIKLDVLATAPERETLHNQWGEDKQGNVEVYVQMRDLIDKGVSINNGDFFVWGDEVFEIMGAIETSNIFGQEDFKLYVKISGRLARASQFDIETFKKLIFDAKQYEESQVVKTFEQQRGLDENDTDGALQDVRQVRDRLHDDMEDPALGEGPRKVNDEEEEDTSDLTDETSSSSFYNE